MSYKQLANILRKKIQRKHLKKPWKLLVRKTATRTHTERKKERARERARERQRETENPVKLTSCISCSFRGVSHIGFCTQCVIMTYVGGRVCVR